VNDWYDVGYYSVSPSTDPQGPPSSPIGRRVLRGGGWVSADFLYLRSPNRFNADPANSDEAFGFRCAQDGGG